MPTSLVSCGTQTALATLTCAGLFEAGGHDARIYVGNRADIASVTETSGVVTAFTLAATKTLKRFIGKPYTNSSQSEDGDLTAQYRLKTQTVTWVGNAVNTADTAALEAIGNSRNLFVVVELETGAFMIYGLDKNPHTGSWTDSRRGMMAKVSIVKNPDPNTPNSATVVFTGENLYSHPVRFNEAGTNAANTTTLEGLCTA